MLLLHKAEAIAHATNGPTLEMWDSDLHLSVTDRCESRPTFPQGGPWRIIESGLCAILAKCSGEQTSNQASIRLSVQSGMLLSHKAKALAPAANGPTLEMWDSDLHLSVTGRCESRPTFPQGGPWRNIESSFRAILAKCSGEQTSNQA